jgi:hypothetical protein
MKKRILFIAMWAIGFFLFALILSNSVFVLLTESSFLGKLDLKTLWTVSDFGIGWNLQVLSMPVFGLLLGLHGCLPGTDVSSSGNRNTGSDDIETSKA